MPTTAIPDEVLTLRPGQVLFEQGDPGGDLYFIQAGKIEIYRTNNQNEIPLAIMAAGEIIGIMTCTTNDPRMASARATEESVVKRIHHDNIQKMMGNLPPWMKIIMKDFTNRLSQMNKNYSNSIMTIKTLNVNQITKLYTGTQVAATLANLAPLVKVKIDEVDGVYIEEIIDRIVEFLNRPKDEIKDIMDIFADSGMIKVSKEPERKRSYITVANCQSLKNFCTWILQAKSGQTRKILNTTFSNRERRTITSLVRFAVKIGLKVESSVKIGISDLEQSMEKSIGQKFEFDAIEQAIKLKLLTLEGVGPDRKICFVPLELSRTMAHLIAYKKLNQLQMKSDQERTINKNAA